MSDSAKLASGRTTFKLRGTGIYDTKTGNLICTIWPERKASEKRLEGESWLAMRQRTQAERDEIERHTEQRAADVCSFLNSHTLEGTRMETAEKSNESTKEVGAVSMSPATSLLDDVRTLYDVLYYAPELNPSNYDHNEVCNLNDATCEAFDLCSDLLNRVSDNKNISGGSAV